MNLIFEASRIVIEKPVSLCEKRVFFVEWLKKSSPPDLGFLQKCWFVYPIGSMGLVLISLHLVDFYGKCR